MAINKVVYHGQTIIDLTADTVTPSTLMQGTTAHDMAGNSIVGTAQSTCVAQDKVATLSTSDQTILPDAGYNALSSVIVPAITGNVLRGLDPNFIAENIKGGVNLFGITGTYGRKWVTFRLHIYEYNRTATPIPNVPCVVCFKSVSESGHHQIIRCTSDANGIAEAILYYDAAGNIENGLRAWVIDNNTRVDCDPDTAQYQWAAHATDGYLRKFISARNLKKLAQSSSVDDAQFEGNYLSEGAELDFACYFKRV